MATRCGVKVLQAAGLALAMFCCTSCIYVGDFDGRAHYEREISLSAPLEPGSSFAADTGDGSITLEGTEASECALQARIVAHARTEEQAEELAEQIDVRLEPAGDGLKVVIDRPQVIHNAWFSVSLQGGVPTRTDLKLSSGDGAIHIANIAGTVEIRTSDGGIEAQDIEGDTNLRTSDGRIVAARMKAGTFDCHTNDGAIKLAEVAAGTLTAATSDGSITLEDVSADTANLRTDDGSIQWRNAVATNADCHSSDGAIHIEYAPAAPKTLNLSVTTSDGSITLVAPPELSAAIDAAVHDGSIHTNLPITIRGKVGKSLQGTIGNGEGRIYFRTNDGSITIR